MEISGIDHVGIVTANIEESSNFYINLLGFVPTETEDAGDLKLKIKRLKRGKDIIELLEPYSKEGATFGLRHIAVCCKDIDRVFQEVAGQNVILFHKSPARYKDIKYFFLKGSDGVLIEFIEHINAENSTENL